MGADGIKILLVEDNPGDSRLLREMLSEIPGYSFEMEVAGGLVDAAAVMESDRVWDVILVDLSLPDSHGLDTFRALSALVSELPIVIMTGMDDRELALEAVREGAQDYIVKGEYSGDVITRILHYAIERKRLLLELAEKSEKEAAQAIRQSEERYRSVYNMAPLAFVVWDVDTRITDWNRHAEKVFGWERQEVLGKGFFDLTIPDNARQQVETVVQQLLQGKMVNHAINDNLTRDGKIITCEWNNATLQDEDGNIVGCLSLAVDITQRVQAEQEIRQRVDNLAALVNVSNRFTSTLELESLFQSTTDGVVELIGLDSSAIYLLEDETLYLWATTPPLPPGFPEIYRQAPLEDHPHIQRAIRTGLPVLLPDAQAAALTDAERQVSESRGLRTTLYLPINQGQGVGGVLIVSSLGKTYEISQAEIDVCMTLAAQSSLAITNGQLFQQLQQYASDLEERIAERTAQLEAKNQDLEAFAYSVSHDLKAPLRGIDGYSNLLQRKYQDQLDEEGRFFIDNIRQATSNMHQLINDLLEYSRLERKEMTLRKVNLEEVLQTLLSEFSNQIAVDNVQMEIDLPCTHLNADIDGLVQVLRNLIDNALKFSAQCEQPRVEIGGRSTQEGCQIWVRDYGIGFDMRYHEKIFENFQRLNQNANIPGTGIGLAIVAKAMERMHGRVWAESKLGEGATFYLEFPDGG